VPQLLEAADFFVLPSDTEGLPLSVLEAMAHGLPIIASRVGGIPELIDDEKEGLLVEPGDADALSTAIQRLWRDRALCHRLGEAARLRAASHFSIAETTEKYEQLYNRVVA